MLVTSINMSINNGDPEKRYDALKRWMLPNRPSIIMLQEVSADIGHAALTDMVELLGDPYELDYEHMIYPGQENEQGLAVITNLGILRRGPTNLPSGGNQAQIIGIGNRKESTILANLHLEAHPLVEGLRLRKLEELNEHLTKNFNSEPLRIVAGDFNALPLFPTIKRMKNGLGFTSASQAAHGKEPNYTFPAIKPEDLVSGNHLTLNEFKLMKRLTWLARNVLRKDIDFIRYPIDYIFTKGADPRFIKSGLIDGRKLKEDPTPISDHLGVWAWIPEVGFTH